MAAASSLNLADRLVAWLSPVQAVRRAAARQQLARAYEGASRTDGWNPLRAGASANADHSADAWTLRIRARSLLQNVPYMAQAMRGLVSNTVGTGIAAHFKGAHAKRLNPLWNRWVDECDADARLDYYGLQSAAYRAMESDGEVLIRLRPRLKSDGLAVPLQLQLLEIDYLDSQRTEATAGGQSIINGIEYDSLGRPAAYWLFDQHPGAGAYVRPVSRRIPAQYIIHLFTPERPSQGRGFPRLAPVIARVRDLQVYEDAELARKNLETRLAVLGHGDLSGLPGGGLEHAEGAGAGWVDNGTLPSGSVVTLPTASGFTVVQPHAPPGYTDYVKQQLHIIAAGFGVPYELMTGDMLEVNFSSARVRLLDFRRDVEAVQWQLIVPRLCNRIAREFEDSAVLAGEVPRADYVVQHSTPKWDYVNPEQDVKADLAEISGGLSSISEKLRRRGYSPDAVFAELKSDIEALREAGVLDILLQLQTGKPTAQTAADLAAPQATRGADVSPDSARRVLDHIARHAADSDHSGLISRMGENAAHTGQVLNRLMEALTRQADRERPAPSIHVEVPAPIVEVRAEAAAPVIHVDVPAPVIEVRAEATTPAINVEVAPAAVTVVDTHPSRAIQTVERDADGEITKTIIDYQKDAT